MMVALFALHTSCCMRLPAIGIPAAVPFALSLLAASLDDQAALHAETTSSVSLAVQLQTQHCSLVRRANILKPCGTKIRALGQAVSSISLPGTATT